MLGILTFLQQEYSAKALGQPIDLIIADRIYMPGIRKLYAAFLHSLILLLIIKMSLKQFYKIIKH